MHDHEKRRALDEEGRQIEVASKNPLLDHRQYEVEYIDGRNEVLTANTITEILLAQFDDDGHQNILIHKIEDHIVTGEAI